MAQSHSLYLTHSLAHYEFPFYTRKNVMKSGDFCAKYYLATFEIYDVNYSVQMFIFCIIA